MKPVSFMSRALTSARAVLSRRASEDRVRRPSDAKASAVGAIVALRRSGRAVWTPRDYAGLAEAGYAQNVVAFRAIRMVAEGAAAIPFQARENGRILSEHPLIGLLARPNPTQSSQELLETVYGYLQTAGNAYLELVRGASGRPIEIYALRPDRMRVALGPDGWPAAYEYAVSGRKHRFEIDRARGRGAPPILHMRSFHPLDDHYGMSPLEAAMKSVDVHNAAGAWTKALLDNAARPSGAVVYTGAGGAAQLTETQYQRLVEELEAHHQGARNAGRPILLEGGLDWRPMGFSPSDMEFQKTKESAAREIALAFGVPPMLLGLPGDATYANYQEANRAFARHALLPLARKTLSAISDWLSPAFGSTAHLTPDLDRIPALASERDARWRRISDADFLTDDEKRALLDVGEMR